MGSPMGNVVYQPDHFQAAEKDQEDGGEGGGGRGGAIMRKLSRRPSCRTDLTRTKPDQAPYYSQPQPQPSSFSQTPLSSSSPSLPYTHLSKLSRPSFVGTLNNIRSLASFLPLSLSLSPLKPLLHICPAPTAHVP